MENQNKFSAKLWYGLGDNYFIDPGMHGFTKKLLKRIKEVKLKRKINDYNSER